MEFPIPSSDPDTRKRHLLASSPPLVICVETSTNLQTFTPFPMTQSQTFIKGAGKLDFYFTAPNNSAFCRAQSSP